MTITITELYESRKTTVAERGKNSIQTRLYKITGSDDVTAIMEYVRAQLPVVLGDLVRDTVGPLERREPNIYDLQVTYIDPEYKPTYGGGGTAGNRPVDSYTFSFDVSTVAEDITHTKLLDVSAWDVDGFADAKSEMFGGGINWNGESFEGIQKLYPALEFTITYKKARGQITFAYLKTLRELTGTVNDAIFYGFPIRSVLFLGATGQQGTDFDPEISYRFRVGYNADGEDLPKLTVGDIGDVTKDAHEYLWVYYKQEVSTTTPKYLVATPEVVFVHKIYRSRDFSQLGIGGTS